MGGIKSKLAYINSKIAVNEHGIIIIQETWMDKKIKDEEILASLNYEIYGMDRDKFKSKKIRGGGVVMFVKHGITYEEIDFIEKTIQAIRIKNGDQNICLVNIDGPPYSGKKQAADELNVILLRLRRYYPDDTLILAGDFNYPDMKWKLNENNRILETDPSTIGAKSLYFVEKMNSFGPVQVNEICNSKNVFLDLVITNEPERISTRKATAKELLDLNSIHHTAIIIDINREDARPVTEEKTRKTRLKLI